MQAWRRFVKAVPDIADSFTKEKAMMRWNVEQAARSAALFDLSFLSEDNITTILAGVPGIGLRESAAWVPFAATDVLEIPMPFPVTAFVMQHTVTIIGHMEFSEGPPSWYDRDDRLQGAHFVGKGLTFLSQPPWNEDEYFLTMGDVAIPLEAKTPENCDIYCLTNTAVRMHSERARYDLAMMVEELQRGGITVKKITDLTFNLMGGCVRIAYHMNKWINQPAHYITRVHDTHPPDNKKWSPLRRELSRKPRYVVLKPDEIKERWLRAHPGQHASPVPHLRRGHYATLSHERYRHLKGQRIWVRACAVKGHAAQWQEQGKVYEILT